MDLNLENKVALVFGGSKGIGLAIARELLNEGAKVCIASRTKTNLENAVNELINENNKSLITYATDINKRSSIKEAFDYVTKHLGAPDIVINNSGGPKMGSYELHSEDVWKDTFQNHFLSLVRVLDLAVPAMKKEMWGRIINISSTVAVEPTDQMCLSASIRAAAITLSKSASLTLSETGITINTICPGGVATDRLLSLVEDQALASGSSISDILIQAQSSIPMKRFAMPKEVAAMALFLCSDAAGYITGRTHMVDGGLVKGT